MADSWTLAKSVLDIELEKPLDAFMLHSRIQHALTGQSNNHPSTETSTFTDKEKRLAVVLYPARLVIVCESGGYAERQKLMLGILDKLGRVINLKDLSAIRYREVSLQEQDVEQYTDLIKKFKDVFFSPKSGLIEYSSDVAVPVSISKYLYPIDLTVGPMQGDELAQKILEFAPHDTLPDFYLITDIVAMTKGQQLSHKFVKSYLAEAQKYFTDLRNTIDKEWK